MFVTNSSQKYNFFEKKSFFIKKSKSKQHIAHFFRIASIPMWKTPFTTKQREQI